MAEKITITVTLEQAEALCEAVTCLAVAADGDIADLINIFTPSQARDMIEANRHKNQQAALAESAGELLRKQIDDAYKRDPETQDYLHRAKMIRKRGAA